jgi:hypothetical protein
MKKPILSLDDAIKDSKDDIEKDMKIIRKIKEADDKKI